jgi:hypothetical protein
MSELVDFQQITAAQVVGAAELDSAKSKAAAGRSAQVAAA